MATLDPIHLLAVVAIVSLAAFAACMADKNRAVTGGRRVPERSLLTLALLGGSPGLLLGMVALRHKTRKASFLGPLLAIVVLQAAAALWFFVAA